VLISSEGKSCPGFGQNNFLVAGAELLWIWDENNVNNILIFLVVARQSRIFSCPGLPGAQEPGRGDSQDS